MESDQNRSEHYLQFVALCWMRAAMYAGLCQVFVAIALSIIIFPISESGISESYKAILEWGILAIGELVLLAVIGFRLRNWIRSYQAPEDMSSNKAPILVVTEGILFKVVLATSLCAALYLKFVGDSTPLALSIVATVVFSFGLVFMLIFVVTRAVMSRKVRLWGLAGIVSCAFALWFAIKNLWWHL